MFPESLLSRADYHERMDDDLMGTTSMCISMGPFLRVHDLLKQNKNVNDILKAVSVNVFFYT